jgi:hypothetical protein
VSRHDRHRHDRHRDSTHVPGHPQILTETDPYVVPLGNVIAGVTEPTIAIDAARSYNRDRPSAYAALDSAGYAVTGAFTASRVNRPAAALVALYHALDRLAGEMPAVIMIRDGRLLRIINAWRGCPRQQIPPREVDPLLYRDLAYDVLWLLRHRGVNITAMPAGHHVPGGPPNHPLFGPTWRLTLYMRWLHRDGITVDNEVVKPWLGMVAVRDDNRAAMQCHYQQIRERLSESPTHSNHQPDSGKA